MTGMISGLPSRTPARACESEQLVCAYIHTLLAVQYTLTFPHTCITLV